MRRSGVTTPFRSRPASRDSAILPPPMNAIRVASTWRDYTDGSVSRCNLQPPERVV